MNQMPNYLPYLLLLILFLTLYAWLLYRTKSFSTVALTFAYIGMIYVLEFFILVLLDCYEYFPNVLPIRYYDNILGSVVSNFIAIPVITTVISLFQLRVRWWLLFILLFAGVELLFIQLGIYELHWWRIHYTMAALVFFFWLSRTWVRKLGKGHKGFQYITLLMGTFSLVATLMFILAVTGVRLFHSGFFENPYRDDVFTAAIYGFVKSLIIATTVFFTFKKRWLILALVIIFAINYTSNQLSIIKVFLPLWLYYLIYIPCCILVIWLEIVSIRSIRKIKLQPK